MPGNQSVHYRQESEEELPGLPTEEVLRSRNDEGRSVETLDYPPQNSVSVFQFLYQKFINL